MCAWIYRFLWNLYYRYICARGYTQISMKLCSKKFSEERSTKRGWVVVLSSPEFLIPVELLSENVTHLFIFGSLIGDISCQGIVDCLNIGNHISWFLIIIQGCSKHPRYVWGVSWVNIEIKLPIYPEWDYHLPIMGWSNPDFTREKLHPPGRGRFLRSPLIAAFIQMAITMVKSPRLVLKHQSFHGFPRFDCERPNLLMVFYPDFSRSHPHV
jgi:hypothetical protein